MKPYRNTERKSNEQGSALVLVLVMVVVVSISGSAVLARQDQGYRTQAVFTNRGIDAAGGDSALNAAMAALRYNPKRANVMHAQAAACGTSPTGAAITISNAPTDAQWEQMETFTTFVDTSQTPSKTYTVKCIPTATSGGTVGNVPEALPYTILALGGYKSPGNQKGNTYASSADNEIVTCYDQGDNGKPGCEASVYVGPATASDVSGSGLIVSSSGSLDRTFIIANGAIAVRSGRNLTVAPPGRVWVRGKCSGWTNGATTAGSVTADNLATGCDKFASDLRADPMLGHRSTTDLANRDRDVSTMLGNVLGQPAGCGFYRNLFVFRPGIYTLTDALNALTQKCAGLYWFEPGTYYFDLNYAGANSGAWNQPPKSGSQVIGGAPKNWVPPCRKWHYPPAVPDDHNDWCDTSKARWSVTGGWNTGINQTGKYLVPTTISNLTNWNVSGNLGQALAIDGKVAWVENTGNTGQLTLGTLATPLPTDGTTSAIQNVKLDLSYAVTNSNFASDYPRVELFMNGGYQKCELVLPAAGRGRIETPVSPLTVDITAACTAKSDDLIYGTNGSNKANGSGVWVPAGTNSPQWKQGNPSVAFSNAQWSATLVNDLRATFVTKSNGSPAKFELDGIKLTLDYTGRPMPPFPGGCSSGQNEGVQWIFGGWSRLHWSGQETFTELCGSKWNTTGTEEDPSGLALYGVGQWEDVSATRLGATPVETKSPTAYSPGAAATAGTLVEYFSGTNPDRTPKKVASVPPDAYNESGDGKFVRIAFPSNGSAWLEANLPNDLVPAGAYVEELQIEVWHGESGIYSAAPRVSVIGPAGTPTWNSDAAPMINDGYGEGLAVTGNASSATKWTAGRYYVDDDPTKDPDTAHWKYGSSLLRTFQDADGTMTTNTASRINGGKVRITWTGAGGGPSNVGMLDKVAVKVRFRSASTESASCNVANGCAAGTVVRPLRGCLTTRVIGDPKHYSTGDPRKVGGAIDWDYDTRWAGGPPKPAADAPYEGPDATGPGGTTDQSACAFLYFDKSEKFRIQGSLYAPTAVVDMRGEDNQTAFVDGSTIVRSLNTYRWKTSYGLNISGWGGSGILYNDRMVYLRVYDSDNKVVVDQRVAINDHDGSSNSLRIGSLTETQWYRRRGDD